MSASLARGFVALLPPDRVLDAVEEVVGSMRAAAQPRLVWSRRAQWHLTLQFLGRVDAVDVLVRALEDGLADRDAPVLGLGGVGAFPSPARASVLWVGLDEGADDAVALADAVARATAPLGHGAEPRVFTPHVTVARARRPLAVGPLLATVGDGPVGPTWSAGAVVLMESDTRPTGAVYREVATVPLPGQRRP